MLGAIRFIIVALILLLLAWWIGNLPGNFIIHSGRLTIQTSVPMAILLFIVILIISVFVVRILGSLRRAPGGFGAWRGGRREKFGQAATHRALVALAADDAKAAELEASRARKWLGDTPLVLLLTAEAARLAGKPDQARIAFEKLTQDKDMAFIGHRGLVRHSLEAGDHDQADRHAIAAETAYPGASWLKSQRFDIAIKKQDFPTALALTRKPAEVAALATGAARAAGNDRDALGYAKQAVKTDATLAPAVVTYAGVLRKLTRNRAAKKALQKGWGAAPHPLIAEAYLANVTAPIERAQAAAELAKSNPGHAESELLLAQTSLAAELTGEAKRHADAAIAAGLTDKRAYAVLATMGDSNAAAAMQHAMQPTWTCSACYTDQPDWHPACPNCAKPGTLVWKTTQSKALVPV